MRSAGLVFVPSLVLAGLVVLAVEPRAQACSGCGDTSEVAPSSGAAMPANAIGIAWSPASTVPAGQLPGLYDVDTDQELPVEQLEVGALVFVYPMDAVAPGKSYRFEIPDDECSSPSMRTLVATEPVALPEVSLGTLVASAPTLGDVSVPADVTCYENVEGVRVEVELQLSPELQPFAESLMYETYVDGERWSHDPAYFHEFTPGSSWTGERGADRLVELCIDGVGGSPNPRMVQMKARIAGAPEVVFESSTVEVVLDCSMVPVGGTDGASGTDGTAGADDGTAGGDGELGGGDDAGCACNTEGGRIGPVFLLTMLALLGLVSRRS